MRKQDFHFELPEHLIAQYPLDKRSHSRLLHYDRSGQSLGHYNFYDLPTLLRSGDLLVMNDSKVIPARLYAKKETGGKLEFLVERIIDDRHFLAHIKGGAKLKAGQHVYLDSGKTLQVMERRESLFLCETTDAVLDLLHEIGHIPLPPYIQRADEHLDEDRYQTIYARHHGSVAAPTAGLHFDDEIIERLQAMGIERAFVTLHVGAGTFQPVRCTNIIDHKMHSEAYTISEDLCGQIEKTKASGGRVIAVGTTAMRTLESAARQGKLRPHSAETDIFIYPGYEFQCCDGLMTNFHLPESTLLMLVAAFIGYQPMRTLYQEAIEQQYRFFSYGDTSLLL